MPPVLSKPRSLVSKAVNDITEPRPTLSVDLSELINNAVENLKLPRRKPKRKIKDPCSICEKRVYDNQKSIQCNDCDLWVHKKCEGISDDEFQKLVEEDDEIPWSCMICQIKHNAEIFPFGLLSKLELLDLMGLIYPLTYRRFPLSKLVLS